MQLHANAALSLNKRRQLCRRVVEESWSLGEAAAAAEVSERTASKWVCRCRAEGEPGLRDRSSAPRSVANRTDERRVEAIATLRRLRFTGPEIAQLLGMALSTVSGIAIAFLRRALAFYRRRGIQVERLLTDNGSAYRSTVHAIACRALGIGHLRTRPRRPQTNGKAERFIRTMLGGWAYGALYRTSKERTRALDGWLWHYNHERRHSALGHKPPAARLRERNNLLGTYT
jgi:transposase InsO family protein